MAPPRHVLFSISIIAYLLVRLTSTSQSNMIIPVSIAEPIPTSATISKPPSKLITNPSSTTHSYTHGFPTPQSRFIDTSRIFSIALETPSLAMIAVSSSASPTPIPGDSIYILIGCYNEPPAITSTRALGATGSYISPTFGSQYALTVPLCLEACGVALAPNSGGPYIYAAVENSRDCYCGLTLSDLSKPVTERYCSSPCAADLTTLCGGYGYLSLYQRISSLSSTNTTFTFPSTASTTTSPLPLKSSNSRTTHSPGFWIGISLGLFIFIFLLLLLSLSIFLKRRYTTRRSIALAHAGLSSSTITPPSFLGGFSLVHSQKRARPTGNAVCTADGRRFGIVVDDAGTDAETYASPLEKSGPGTLRSRPTFEEWKSGVVSPAGTAVTSPVTVPATARVPAGPEAITHSVRLESIASPVGTFDPTLGTGTGGENREVMP